MRTAANPAETELANPVNNETGILLLVIDFLQKGQWGRRAEKKKSRESRKGNYRTGILILQNRRCSGQRSRAGSAGLTCATHSRTSASSQASTNRWLLMPSLFHSFEVPG